MMTVYRWQIYSFNPSNKFIQPKSKSVGTFLTEYEQLNMKIVDLTNFCLT